MASKVLSNLIRGQRNIITKSFVRPLSTSKAVRETFTVQDEDDFKEKVINSQIPVIVDFSATWCGPCKILGPRLGTFHILRKHQTKELYVTLVSLH